MKCKRCGWPWGINSDGLCENCVKLELKPDNVSRMTHLGKTPFKDMKHLTEVERIDLIAQYLVANPGKTIAVLVDVGEGHEDKGDRYIRAVKEKLPDVIVRGRRPGPVPHCETITLILEKHEED